jgi:hypothetical protein
MRAWQTTVSALLLACALALGVYFLYCSRENQRVRSQLRTGIPEGVPIVYVKFGRKYSLSESQAASFRRIISCAPTLMRKPSTALPPLGVFTCGNASYDWEGSWLTMCVDNTKVAWEDPVLDRMMQMLAQAHYASDANTINQVLALLGSEVNEAVANDPRPAPPSPHQPPPPSPPSSSQ